MKHKIPSIQTKSRFLYFFFFLYLLEFVWRKVDWDPDSPHVVQDIGDGRVGVVEFLSNGVKNG